jgi:hypothetical protein
VPAIVVLLAVFVSMPARAAEPMCVSIADHGGEGSKTIDGEREDEDLLSIVDLSDPDPDSNETNVGDGTNTYRVESAAFQPGSGVLFAVDADRLVTISLDSGKASVVGVLGSTTGKGGLPSVTFDNIVGLTFDRDGTLWASQRVRSGRPDLLVRVDPDTGSVVGQYVAVEPVGGLSDIEDIAADPASDRIYAVANLGGRNDRLVWIDPDTGATTDVGALGVNDMEGLAFTSSGSLIGTSKRVPGVSEGGVWDIDKATGDASNPRTLDNGSNKESITCQQPRGPQPSPSPTPTPGETVTPSPTPTTTVGPNITRRGSITVIKNAIPNSGEDFAFTGDLGSFLLDDDDDATLARSRLFDELRPGTYVVSETIADEWELTALACVDPNGGTTTSVADARATISLDGSEHVVCTFTNQEESRVLERIRRLPASGTEVATAMGPIGLGVAGIGAGLRSVATHRARPRRRAGRVRRPVPSRSSIGVPSARMVPAHRVVRARPVTTMRASVPRQLAFTTMRPRGRL